MIKNKAKIFQSKINELIVIYKILYNYYQIYLKKSKN
jgi:hypothetical protein